MEQLNTLDAGFLMAEDSDRHVSLAIGGIAIVEGSAPSDSRFTSVLAERIHAIPRCTQVLRTHPSIWVPHLGRGSPLRPHSACAPGGASRPGGDRELFRVVADVVERRLDRDRPLWECWVIEGLQGNRWAIVVKIHHCVADGVSATRILTRLCDDADGLDSSVFACRVGPNRTARPSAHLRPLPDAEAARPA